MSIFTPGSFAAQQTVSYRTFLKTAFVEALNEVWTDHPDTHLRTQFDNSGNRQSGVYATIEQPTDAISYPCIVVKWLERRVQNAGVGHIEYIWDPNTSSSIPFRHAYYEGQIEFGAYALSSLDRDLVADSLVQIMRMPDMASYTTNYFNQVFNDVDTSKTLHFLNVDTDNIYPVGETTSQPPWLSENYLQYQSGYRANVFGEFYNIPPDFSPAGVIDHVNIYPYIYGVDPVPAGKNPNDPAIWEPPGIPNIPDAPLP